MRLFSQFCLSLLFSFLALRAYCTSEVTVPESFVIIETLTPNQEGGFNRTFCPGFMKTEYDLVTAYRCAIAAPENLRAYRSTKDCNDRRHSMAVKITGQRDTLNEPTTVGLLQSVDEDMVAITQFPHLDLDEPLKCFFLSEHDKKLSFNMRSVNYYDAVKKGIFKIITTQLSSFHGKPVPGAILVNSIGAITGVSFKNNQIYSPMHGFIVPFHTVALDERGEL